MGNAKRLYYIDWLRVIAFGLLIFYHTGMFFVPWDFHFKNNQTSEMFELWMVPLSQVRLPLLFMISGMGVFFAFSHRKIVGFIKERSTRLMLPLIFGMLVVIPPQIYFERLTQNVHYNSYFDFWKTVFDFVPYPEGGSFSWHHLWYVLYIFIYSLLVLPLLKFLRSDKSFRLRTNLLTFFLKPGGIYIIALPLLLVYYFLSPLFPTTHSLIDDWYNLTFSLIFFIYGMFIISVEGLWGVIERNRKLSLKIALVPFAFLWLFVWGPTFTIMDEKTTAFFYFYGFLKITYTTSLLLAILGYSRILLNKTNKFIVYANEAVYPFYILHQSVMLIFGYYILQMNIGILPKFILVVLATFGGSWIVYEFVVKRFNVTRVLFGMKPFAKEKKIEIVSAIEGK